MTTLRHTLQQEVFQPNEERLLTFCHVSKLFKKKKTSYLCIVSNMNPPFGISIVQIKQTDKAFKKKRVWELPELKTVDGINESNDTHEFDLHLDKVYRWVALNFQEKHVFIITLFKQCTKHIAKDKPTFKNIQTTWITEDILTPEKFVSSPILGVESVDISEDFQALTEKEENDISRLMAGCEFAISNAEAFMEVLARDLSLLDGENVQCVLASENQVEALMDQMETAIVEAERVEKRLDAYDEILCHVRETMEQMEKKNFVIEVANKNNLLLFKELENIVKQLDFAHSHQLVLEKTDLTSPQGLNAAIRAGNALRDAMNCQLNPALLRLSAVQEQKKRFEKYKDTFSHSICRQLNNLFIHLGNDKGDPAPNVLTLPQHGNVHRELSAYTELMHWSKIMDRKAYAGLRKVYTDSLGKLYDRDLKALFEAAQNTVAAPGQATTPTKPIVAVLGVDHEQWTMEITAADRKKYDSTLEQVLSQLEPVFMQEQAFCVSFFHLDVMSPSTKNTLTTLDGIEAEIAALPSKKAEKQMNEEVRGMMSDLFSCLEEELIGFIAHIEKQDSFYCMYVLVRLNQHVMSAQSTYLSNCIASVLILIKRALDRFMQQQVDSVRECRVPRRSKCGILPYVYNLEEFARSADVLLRSDRRADLEKWYIRLVDTMIEAISLHSGDHHKTPSQVVKMENYHYLNSLLSQLKIAVLDSQRKEAKQRYNDALAAYVKEYFGRPLEKLNQFFEGVQSRVASGVKISEVGYQLAFSKQELRKVIQQYPGSTVKKGVEALYRKVEKHLSEEGNLLQVVWRAMQEEFIGQYKNLEELIQRCYPGSMITLDFTIENILEYFSEIARSH